MRYAIDYGKATGGLGAAVRRRGVSKVYPIALDARLPPCAFPYPCPNAPQAPASIALRAVSVSRGRNALLYVLRAMARAMDGTADDTGEDDADSRCDGKTLLWIWLALPHLALRSGLHQRLPLALYMWISCVPRVARSFSVPAGKRAYAPAQRAYPRCRTSHAERAEPDDIVESTRTH
ncbi:hypothetical protein HYPSUDRAFT_208617 [Hypholoma sublateritium FD-334 SS-4]|uniref:Uncharacterized protein n=1 Tax=Hypholoma sublateritium (strain FD-334 SS-4) TaxID=945553 RepID=A0A0D2LUM9_HYPSF|nr:hypothetical protein HYPSUDRAFT_208617 [Hypholoma sublateritium FD-334 SS-4]